jgi:hypothetical protein
MIDNSPDIPDLRVFYRMGDCFRISMIVPDKSLQNDVKLMKKQHQFRDPGGEK